MDKRQVKGSGWRTVYETLRNEILTLTLQPGQLLDENTLAERFGMSRSPVREALIRLAGEELVVTLSNRSTIVAPIEVRTFPKYVEALDIAQRMTTRLAAALRTAADLKQIASRQQSFEAAVQANDYLEMSEANKQFHLAIAKAGKNPYFTSFYERLLNQGQRMLHLHFEYIERTQDSYLLTDEHNQMFEAIRAKDVDLADQLAHAHTRQFQDNFINFMRENYTSDVSLSPLTTSGNKHARRD
ncbi:GntR family transcriptional regulator [Pseudochelatococcus contaminans]|uniref:DNA-binding GntR family transcriptional regulator n=1 Tax=Pseudochelatococcus contaminans TaxID=1538103 RepID=A0A7W5Z652_9HYPH|nr:GntR family transcriptional regulator [Pseudochelatococcus contaminans]MBB3810414.1 DNA-binding GntR family transcriptional regulator [Pseudochelatococcus contaminans]